VRGKAALARRGWACVDAYTIVSGRPLRPETIAAVANAMDDIRNRVDPILRFERSSEKGD
jgi:hypothetical protein